ncbi:uncharacterized protein BO88DRAFT_462619 [Aspergillus vadensis CBS 113365]|uniref:DUF676 domain-containing protein n=1 Tax=Aspergillus vadensis (strain CBS 113365 / IMI 142717 / IBT 24658) TaxID=1448311 RepID=A0A319BBE5_ASPVC|nr:hypothetical protein BO88DRAFT_462619 [Aspergillus vadensis CBS 113365]PYH69234.1 hypothetical protein BO88DRAFT_462619 [Aspergillus vadensis CBS 113365]
MKEHASDNFALDSWRDASYNPDELPRHEGKRRLLLIYIHGFLGSEDSFCNFPREVHNLQASLAQTHVTYTKIYPRYKTRGPIRVARNDVSRWLSPHMAPDLDVILLGHSIGGLIAADVALAESYTIAGHVPNSRVVGLVAFDTPFLGLHPRVIATAAGRVLSRKAKDESRHASQSSTDSRIANDDPTFDPNLTNDVDRTQWTGWDGARHFLAKHSCHLSRSALQYVFSYYDHVGCLNDYFGLVRRHKKLCRWAKRDESGRQVRFVNYYTTACPHSETTNGNDHGNKMALRHRASQIHEYRVEDGVSALLLPDIRADIQGKVADNRSSESLLDTKLSSTRVDIRSSSSSCNLGEQRIKPEGSHLRPSGRLFCYVPETARKEQLWVPLRMEGMDEIAAHQSMFLPLGTYYDRLVADTVAKIESWLI